MKRSLKLYFVLYFYFFFRLIIRDPRFSGDDDFGDPKEGFIAILPKKKLKMSGINPGDPVRITNNYVAFVDLKLMYQ